MNKIKFLGTAGGRFVVSRQLRNSGGIWLSLNATNLLIDPGPGSLVRILSSKPKLNPRDLDGIILSHKHLEEGGTRKEFSLHQKILLKETLLF